MKHLVFILHGSSLGGAQRSCLEILARAPKQWRITVLTPDSGPLLEQLNALGVTIELFDLPIFVHTQYSPGAFSLPKVWTLLRQTISMYRRLRVLRPDLVVLNSSVLVFCGIAAQFLRIPVVAHIREILPALESSRLTAWVLTRLAGSARRIIVESEFSRGCLGNLIAAEKIYLCPNWVALEEFSPQKMPNSIRAELGIAANAFVVAICGQLLPEKGVYDLLQALFILSAEPDSTTQPPLRCLLIGDTDLAMPAGAVDPRLRSQINALGLSASCVCVGTINAVPEYLAAADCVVVLPKIPESFGKSAVEAMAMGKPVIASDIGPMREILSDSEGILVRPGSPKEVAAAIARLRANPTLTAELGKAARVAVDKRFDATERIAELWREYAEVLE